MSITAPSFTLNVSPAFQAVVRENGTRFDITVTPQNGFSGAVTLSIAGMPAETAASFRKQYPDYRTTTFEQLWLSRSGSSTYRVQIHPLFERIRTLGVAN